MFLNQPTHQLSAEIVAKLLRHFPEGLTALDLETTGLSPMVDKVVEIAMVKLDKSGGMQTFSSLINPKMTIPEATIKIHGISNSMVEHSPTLDEIWDEAQNFMQKSPLLAHNGKFDIGFIVSFLKTAGRKLPHVDVYDSCTLARQLLTGEGKPSNYKLSTLAAHFNVPLENYHRATDDALACLMITGHTLMKQQTQIDRVRDALNKSWLFNLRQFEKPIELEVPSHLQELIVHAEKETPLWIDYRGGTHNEAYRPVRPLALMLLPTGPVLNALCMIDNRYKNFALIKIRSFHTALDGKKFPELQQATRT